MEELNLESIFRKRFHGAVNIRGIDFQILYTIYEGLLLITENRTNDTITLEGIEDVDLNQFESSGTFVQVKTAETSWHWAELKKVIPGFAEVISIDPNCHFKLVVNFQLRPVLDQLSTFNKQPIEIQNDLVKNFEKLCRGVKVDPVLGRYILEKLSIHSISRETLLIQIKQLLINAFDIHAEVANAYIYCFAYQFINWAIERKKVTNEDICQIHINLSEAFLHSQQFEAYGKFLIGKIDWTFDKQPSDYFSGKRTRPGHIALDLDVERLTWLEKIDLVLAKKQICIIKAASGEGKSTLAFRYAYKYWTHEYTYIIHQAKTRTESEEIINYLKGLVRASLPITLLIDDVREDISYYSEILGGCSANKIKTIVTIRNEDYERLSSWNLSDYEIITPAFDLVEAKAIYKNLKLNDGIHPNAISAESAFEQIGSSATVIEYIFFITQGKMLEERLREQIQIMRKNGEINKIELLRQLIVAHACRVSIEMNQLCTAPTLDKFDIQTFLIELSDEYISIKDNRIDGYHWVRSNHLVKLLHEQYRNIALTGVKVLGYLEERMVIPFIENILSLENVDECVLIDGLVDKASINNLPIFYFV